MGIRLNCDMGEGFGIWSMGDDEAIMPLIDMANLACGFHASDPANMYKSVSLAKKHNVSIGAHPSYPDLVGFGRRSMKLGSEELIAILLYQISALEGICKAFDTTISHIKPHGALYNDMMSDLRIFEDVAKSVSLYDSSLPLMILSQADNSVHKAVADKYNVSLLYEVFADRNYTQEGHLVPRTNADAVIKDDKKVLERLDTLKEGFIYSVSNEKLSLPCDSLCVHSDSPNAFTFIQTIRHHL